MREEVHASVVVDRRAREAMIGGRQSSIEAGLI